VAGRVGHAPGALVLDDVVEAVAEDILHDHEVDVALEADLERPRDVRVLDSLGQLHLAEEPLQGLPLLQGLLGRKDLDRDLLAVAALLDGEVDLAHPALPELAEDAVAAEEEP